MRGHLSSPRSGAEGASSTLTSFLDRTNKIAMTLINMCFSSAAALWEPAMRRPCADHLSTMLVPHWQGSSLHTGKLTCLHNTSPSLIGSMNPLPFLKHLLQLMHPWSLCGPGVDKFKMAADARAIYHWTDLPFSRPFQSVMFHGIEKFMTCLYCPHGYFRVEKFELDCFAMRLWKWPKSGLLRVVTYKPTYISRFSRPFLSPFFHT